MEWIIFSVFLVDGAALEERVTQILLLHYLANVCVAGSDAELSFSASTPRAKFTHLRLRGDRRHERCEKDQQTQQNAKDKTKNCNNIYVNVAPAFLR
jgi:hypothetical protein